MAEAVASSIIGMVFNRLGSLVADELRSLKDVGEDLVKLRSTLDDIRNVLEDAEARQVKEKALAGWLRKLKDVAFDIDDVLDEIAAPEHMPDKSGYKQRVRKYLSFPKSLQFRLEIAKKIQKIRKRLDMISEEKSRYNLREGAATEHSETEGNRETGSYVDKSQVYGRDEDQKRIIHFLLHKCNEQNLGVISIVGLGGLGKTTLARLVYNDGVRVSKHFETKIWVYVSQRFEIKSVITSIIESIEEGKKLEPLSMDLIEKKLLKQIEGKKILLVLDDVWNEDYEQWDRLGCLLKNGAKGSKVIVTTRSARVASVVKSDESLSLGGLPDDECQKLFEKHAFMSDDDAKNRNLVAIGKEIVKKCRGLPLAAKALGSILRFKREESQWRVVRDNEIWTLFEDDKDILPALMLSYNHLSPRLKQCFSYCSIFPKGTDIYVTMLVQLWIAEGFVVDSSEGSWYVDQLISRSLLEKDVRKFIFRRVVDVVKMHDMVHNLAQFIAGDECLIVDATSGNNTKFSPKSRYASLVLNEVTPLTAQVLSSGQKLRTFHLMATNEYSHFQSNKHSSHLVLLETIVFNMQLLRALHLPGLPIEKLPDSITKLVHLRYLDLSNTTCLKSLPKDIGLLHNLQILKLNSIKLATLPESIGDLVKLLILEISCCTSFHSLPDSIGKLERLQYLDLSYATNLQALPPTIGTLQYLQTLDLTYCRELKELPESIVGLKNLVNLHLHGCMRLYSLPDNLGCMLYLQVLNMAFSFALKTLPESLCSLYNLHSLSLFNCNSLQELPKNIQSIRSLTHLDIENCDSLTSMPAGIGQLSHLRTLPMYVLGDRESCASLAELGTMMNLEGPLRIKNLQNVKDVAEASAANLREKQRINSLGLEWDFDADWSRERYEGIDDFENKRKELIEIVAAMDGEHVRLLEDVVRNLQPRRDLPRLQMKGYVGKMLPGWMMDLSNLVELKLESFTRCDTLQALEKLSCLEVLKLRRFLFIECLPRLGQLPRLRVLKLCMLPRVKCLATELYGGAGAFPALEELKLQLMLGLEEWSGNSISDERDDFLVRLSRLVVMDCPKLRALPPIFFPSVKHLGMNADDKLMLSYLERGAFPNLYSLYVYNFVETEDGSSMPEELEERLYSVPSEDIIPKKIRWNHSEFELEMMRLETLERIAMEIENKLVFEHSSSS